MSTGIGPVDLAYAFGLVVVVPMGVWLLGGKSGGAVGAAVLGAIGAAGLFMVPTAFHGSILMLPWLVFVLVLAIKEVVGFLWSWSWDPPDVVVRALRVIACVFLVVSAASAGALRWEVEPFGFPELVVGLTAVHYLFTGFGAVLFCWKAASWDAIERRSVALLGAGCVVVGTPVIATGITIRQITGVAFFSVGEALGATLIAVGLVIVAWQVFRGVARAPSGMPSLAKVLLRVPMAVVVISMGLAVLYGMHRWLGTPALDERQMAQTHGMLNALGFVACGLAGWIVIERAAQPQDLPPTG